MIGDPLESAVNATVIYTEHAAAQHQPHVGEATQFGDNRLGPRVSRHAAELAIVGQQASAGDEILLTHDDARARTRGHLRGCQSGGAGADN